MANNREILTDSARSTVLTAREFAAMLLPFTDKQRGADRINASLRSFAKPGTWFAPMWAIMVGAVGAPHSAWDLPTLARVLLDVRPRFLAHEERDAPDESLGAGFPAQLGRPGRCDGLLLPFGRRFGEAALAARAERLDQVVLEAEDLSLVDDVREMVRAVVAHERRVAERKVQNVRRRRDDRARHAETAR